MTFSKYVCWKTDMVRQVMDVEATQPEDHIFLATHHPTKMYRQNLTEAQSRIPYDGERLLKDFLETPDFAFVPILGTSGTGKSHLIRWLYTRLKGIRKEPHYRVLLIPKVGTNLRDILERILTGIEGSEFDEYRSRLRQATNTLTEAEAREQLLANLAISVGLSGKSNISYLSEIEYEVAKGLPDLLRDPYFTEQFWLKPKGIIERLVTHILGTQNRVEDVEERRGFSVEDLPTGILNRERASEKARDFYTHLDNDFIPKQEVVEWLNRHLDAAIAKVLNLGREDLQRLMLDVRRALARQGVELILLIEDFAKLQGIDREVLEAVLARPQQIEGEPLCAMRTALACTTGYFQGLIDTVRTRTDFSVNLDIETVDEQSLVTQTDVQQLASRYLNAARLSNEEIQAWLRDTDEETGQPYHSVPNACLDCDYRPACHAGFGQIDGVGLYPFNAKAIERMRARVNTGVFNPRTLIKNVLRYILEYHRSDLEEGRFPSPLLLAHFRGSPLSTIITQNIKSTDTPDNASRREALLNLWTDGSELCDLPPEVHAAFDLRPLGIQVQKPVITTTSTRAKTVTATFVVTPTTVTPTTPVVEAIGTVSLPTKLAEQLQALDEWRTGTPLPQLVAQALRPLVFDAINTRTDWAAALLLRNQFVEKAFKSTNIVFRNDFKGRNASSSDNASLRLTKGINLILPAEDSDLGDTTFTLQAILLYHHYKHWRFDNGAAYFRTYARKLEEWSNFVLSEIPKIPAKSSTVLDPVPAVVELLAIASRMAGRSTESLEKRINAIFMDLEKVDVAHRADSWQKLFNTLKKHQPKLREILDARIPCTKGGSTRLQVIDTAQLLTPLNEIVKDWQPKVNVSEVSINPPFDVIGETRKAVDTLLDQAVREEQERQLAFYQQVVQELGEDFSKQNIISSLEQAVAQAKNAGVFRSPNSASLEAAINDFRGAQLNAYLKSMRDIQGEEDIGVLLSQLSTISPKPVEILSNFLKQAKEFLGRSLTAATTEIENLRATGSSDLESTYLATENSLQELQNLANEIKGEAQC
ncbi:protein DpdH [Leptolyngbya sp. FACHB-261]|uniref:protein DpdH n=1 Tax=Leptolyngbya sp. FACHB-261 TaxID=2692806 RepID=UPI001684F4B4|nr:protein DpdH [Leptolyngbya sp. FACHB-261]MBD2101018.1 hypothetical protein [Leptolyngbya sp. FACHB-261]